MENEIIIKTDLKPGRVDENFDEVKKRVKEEMKQYEGLVFSDDQVKDAKSTRANLNKLRKQIDDRRKAIKKQWNEPYVVFENKVKEVLAIIDPPLLQLASQINGFEERRKEEKQKELREMMQEVISKQDETVAGIVERCNWVYDERWENASVSVNQASKQLSDKIEAIQNAVETIDDGSKYAGQLLGVYEETGDLTKVLKNKKELEERDKRYAEMEARKKEQEAKAAAEAEAEAKKEQEVVQEMEDLPPTSESDPEIKSGPAPEPEPEPEPEQEQEVRYVRTFTVDATFNQIKMLVDFMKSQGINYKLEK